VLYAAGLLTRAGGQVSYGLARWARNETSCRAGNVGTGGGAAATDVLFVNGDAGRGGCRRVIVGAFDDVTISIAPSGGLRHFALWTLDGAPRPGDAAPVEFRAGDGTVVSLGTGCLALPTGNLVTPGSVPCPLGVPRGVTSRRLGSGTAATLCLDGRNPLARAPVSFTARFPSGNWTLGGVIADAASAAARPVSLMNWVIVTSQ
jgi:hypothetical protein